MKNDEAANARAHSLGALEDEHPDERHHRQQGKHQPPRVVDQVREHLVAHPVGRADQCHEQERLGDQEPPCPPPRASASSPVPRNARKFAPWAARTTSPNTPTSRAYQFRMLKSGSEK